jgi:small multidrug resistance pump
MTTWALLAVTIVLEVIGTLSLRAMDGFTDPWWLVTVVMGYGGAFLGMARVLKMGMAVGVVYGIWAAFGIALTAVAGSIVFGDALTWAIGVGIVLIICGVLLVEIGSRSATPTN